MIENADTIDLLWEAKGIAPVIKRTIRQTNHMLITGQLPAKKVAGRWCVSRSDLAQFFAAAAPVGGKAA